MRSPLFCVVAFFRCRKGGRGRGERRRSRRIWKKEKKTRKVKNENEKNPKQRNEIMVFCRAHYMAPMWSAAGRSGCPAAMERPAGAIEGA